MTGGPSHHESDTIVSAMKFVNDRKTAARGVLGDRPRVERGICVGIEISTAAVAKGTKFVEVTTVVREQQFRARGGSGGYHDEVTFEV
jgi:hypothetical protein